MRTTQVLLLSVCFALGCGSSSTNNVPDAAGMDLAVASDLSQPDDLATKPLSCSALIKCLSMGGQSGATSCFSSATPKALMLLNTLLACGKAACSASDGGAASDAGGAACTGPQDQSATCLQCAQQDVQSGDCQAEVQACLSDM